MSPISQPREGAVSGLALTHFVRFAQIFACRGQPGGWFLSFACPKERNQRKRHPLRRPSGALVLTGKLGGCATRPGSPHKSRAAAELEQCSPFSPICPSSLSGAEGGILRQIGSASSSQQKVIASVKRSRSGYSGTLFPLGPPPSSADEPGEVGEHCSNPERRRREVELRSRPAWRATQGTPKGRRMGVAFFGLPFLAKQER